MMKRHLLVIGPMPPPIHGESLAIKQLIDSKEVRGSFHLTLINTNRKRTDKGGKFALSKVFQDIRILVRVLKTVRRNTVDIMYLSLSQSQFGLIRDALLIRMAGKKTGRIIAHLHGNNLKNVLDTMNPLIKRLVLPALGQIESGIALSRGLAFNFMNLPNHVTVVPNGISCDYFTEQEVIEARGDHPDEPVFRILYLSNLMETKGFALLIQAVTDLLKEGLRVELNLAGQIYDRPLFEQVMHEVETAGFKSDITYLGTVTGERKKQLLRHADVMVLPTAYPIEGQPISIIEGMASGLPIISTDQGAIPELIGESGIVLKKASRKSLARAIKEIMGDSDLYRHLSASSRKRFLEHYTLDHYIGGLIAVFNRGGRDEEKDRIRDQLFLS